MAEQINKGRLDELLGIHEGQTFEDYMGEATQPMQDAASESISAQTAQMLMDTREKVDEIEQQFQQNMEIIDRTKSQMQNGDLPPVSYTSEDEDGSASRRIDGLVNVENAFKSIEDLVDTTKNMIANVYGIISSCDVLDSETVGAAAALIGETRQLISEYTGLYRQRVKFFDQVKMEMLKQQHRKELMDLKQKYDLEKLDRRGSVPATAQEVSSDSEVPPGMVSMSTEDMLKMFQNLEDDETEQTEQTEGEKQG